MDICTTAVPPVGIPSISLSPQVVAERASSTDNSRLEPVMICHFNKPLPDLFYNFRWYIENNLLTGAMFDGVAEDDINTTAVLRPEHWTSQYNMNMNVRSPTTLTSMFFK